MPSFGVNKAGAIKACLRKADAVGGAAAGWLPD
jgi:hypothetical protein